MGTGGTGVEVWRCRTGNPLHFRFPNSPSASIGDRRPLRVEAEELPSEWRSVQVSNSSLTTTPPVPDFLVGLQCSGELQNPNNVSVPCSAFTALFLRFTRPCSSSAWCHCPLRQLYGGELSPASLHQDSTSTTNFCQFPHSAHG